MVTILSKPPLSKQAFIDAALQVIAKVGVQQLSMRKVASQLGVSPMAMYKYFPNKEDLLIATLDAFISQSRVVPDRQLPWEAWVEQMARNMYAGLSWELSWVPLLGSLRLGAEGMQTIANFSDKLTEAGFTAEQSLHAFLSILQVVVGAVCLHSSWHCAQKNIPVTTTALPPSVPAAHLEMTQQMNRVMGLDPLSISLPLLIEALRAQQRLNRQAATDATPVQRSAPA